MKLAGAFALILTLPLSGRLQAHSGKDVLVVVNGKSLLSRRIGEYYVKKREVPLAQVCYLSTQPDEAITRETYDSAVERPIAQFLRKGGLEDKVLFMVTTVGVPLKIAGVGGDSLQTDAASVDSELAALYGRMHAHPYPTRGAALNPYFRHLEEPFAHPKFPIYLVTRLAGYSFADVQGLIDHSLAARDRGTFVFDARADNNTEGNAWLRNAARALPKERVMLEDTGTVLYGLKNVIGYASWGSNDPDRHKRDLGFSWLPGAISTEYVSTNARSFVRPPDSWNIGNWKDTQTWFAGSPQTMTADLVQEGVTGASGHVFEPFLEANPRPDYLFPAYYSGRTLGESYYVSMPAISWMNVVIGDPLCRIR
ncbi:MAG: TIGR03790 family protein [Acidobacteriota bacterium]|nr:TIGR03790 family protein [Acidobacteriota bacterium]